MSAPCTERPPADRRMMSSSSNFVLIGRMMSARHRVVLEPQMLDHEGLYLGTPERLYGLEPIVPACGAARVVHPYHVDLGAALFFGDRVDDLAELVFERGEEHRAARALGMPLHDRVVELGLGDQLLRRGPQLTLAGEEHPFCLRPSAGKRMSGSWTAVFGPSFIQWSSPPILKY